MQIAAFKSILAKRINTPRNGVSTSCRHQVIHVGKVCIQAHQGGAYPVSVLTFLATGDMK